MSVDKAARRGGTYSDIEQQTVKFQMDMGAGEQNENGVVAFREEVLGPQGLDRDQVAELVAARYFVAHQIKDDDIATNQTPGSSRGFSILGLNTRDGVIQGEQTGVDETEILQDTGASTVEAFGRVSDDPGLLFEQKSEADAAFNDTASGTGGGAAITKAETVIPYREWFGHGPIVDATDDIEGQLRITHDEVGGTTELTLFAQMYWEPLAVEGGRPQFGMPNP